ncbi:MAG: hypothetical protein U1E81_09290 [Xanthobacteraceae bacterium]
MTDVSIVGVDLAKQAFQLHAAARDGSVIFRRKLSRSKFVECRFPPRFDPGFPLRTDPV